MKRALHSRCPWHIPPHRARQLLGRLDTGNGWCFGGMVRQGPARRALEPVSVNVLASSASPGSLAARRLAGPVGPLGYVTVRRATRRRFDPSSSPSASLAEAV